MGVWVRRDCRCGCSCVYDLFDVGLVFIAVVACGATVMWLSALLYRFESALISELVL